MKASVCLLLALFATVACRAGGDERAPTRPLSVAEAVEADGRVIVEGFVHIVAVPRDQIRLCAALSDAIPPACRPPALRLARLPKPLPTLEATADGIYLWSRAPVRASGTVRGGVLHATDIER